MEFSRRLSHKLERYKAFYADPQPGQLWSLYRRMPLKLRPLTLVMDGGFAARTFTTMPRDGRSIRLLRRFPAYVFWNSVGIPTAHGQWIIWISFWSCL